MPEPTSLRPPRRALALLVAAAVLFGAAACSKDEAAAPLAQAPATAGTSGTAAPTTAGGPANLVVGDVTLPGPPYTVITPKEQGQLNIHDAPEGAVVRTLPNPRLINNDPNAAVPLTLLQKQDPGTGWIEVYLPIRPNGSTGWVAAADVTAALHEYRIEVRLAEFNLRAYNGDQLLLDAPIAVASDNTPTPGGLYYTTELIQPTDDRGRVDPNGPYGTYAYGLSGFSEVLETFNGGPGQLGIHGTNEPEKVGTKVSNGCIRLRNADIDKLAGVLPLGVPVVVLA